VFVVYSTVLHPCFQLLDAALRGQTAEVTRLLNAGVPIDSVGSEVSVDFFNFFNFVLDVVTIFWSF
jgi:hypothetical protein